MFLNKKRIWLMVLHKEYLWKKIIFEFSNLLLPYLSTKCPPQKKKVDLLVRKQFFWRHLEKIQWWSFFYVNFIKKMFIRAKVKECIFWKKRSVYIRAHLFYLKLQNFGFYELWPSYKVGKRWKTDPFVKSLKYFEGGGTLSWQIQYKD